MVTLDELEKADISTIPISKRVEAFYKGTDAISKFAEKMIIPILKGQLTLSDKEKALIGTYLRMYAWVRSMVSLNSRIHFQATAAAARALFELFVDIIILSNDENGEYLNKYRMFPEIDKYYKAKQVVSFCEKNKGKTSISDAPHRAYIDVPEKAEEIKNLIGPMSSFYC